MLEEMARALYREWFVHFRFPGHEYADLRVASRARPTSPRVGGVRDVGARWRGMARTTAPK